jgi:hypothetical protein
MPGRVRAQTRAHRHCFNCSFYLLIVSHGILGDVIGLARRIDVAINGIVDELLIINKVFE